jgi:dihydroorotate dehydrogenase electron transfer subunit
VFYPNFPPDYLQQLSLPANLAPILHTVRPQSFDIFYKVLKHGTGTRELKDVKKGQTLSMLGPLGGKFELRELRSQGFDEIHVIGGGVGMAPLVYMVQILRFNGFRIKAFLGVESLEMLRHKDELAESYVEDPANVLLYHDDLLAAGLEPEDIFISCEKPGMRGLPVDAEHYHQGFVSEQYEHYLKTLEADRQALAFACGPTPMMKAVYKITSRAELPLKVLLERRMACGFGVCLSCVCRTRDGEYRRVCTDGPIFDADEVDWEE